MRPSVTLRRMLVWLTGLVAAVGVGLRLWHAGDGFQARPSPLVAVEWTSGNARVEAAPTGIGMWASRQPHSLPVGISSTGWDQLPKAVLACTARSPGPGSHVNLLGLQFAALTRPIDAQCIIEWPYVMVVVPYWLVIGGGCGVFVSAIARRPWQRSVHGWTRSGVLTSLMIGGVFLGFNVVSPLWRSGPLSRPWPLPLYATMTFAPTTALRHGELQYGFPLLCWSQVVLNGQFVEGVSEYGHQSRWWPERAAENLVLAILAMGMAGRFVSHRRPEIPWAGVRSGAVVFGMLGLMIGLELGLIRAQTATEALAALARVTLVCLTGWCLWVAGATIARHV